jgi:hypothetical protein
VFNVVYSSLVANTALYNTFVWKIKEGIAEKAGLPVTGHDVMVWLSPGSVHVVGHVYADEQHSDTVTANLWNAGKTGTLTNLVMTKVQSVPGIDTVKSGHMSVLGIHVDNQPINPAPPPPPPPPPPPSPTPTPVPSPSPTTTRVTSSVAVRRRRSVPVVRGSSQFNYGFSAVLLALALAREQALPAV